MPTVYEMNNDDAISASVGEEDLASLTTDSQSTINALKKKILVFNRFVQRFGLPKSEWPGVTGDWYDRASTVVRFNSPFYTISVPYKDKAKTFLPYDPLRVVLYLDEQGFVAVTPKADILSLITA